MNSFSEAVESCCRFISEKKMLKAEDCVVAGVSGGADSVFLFHVLLAMAEGLNLQLVVAHLNHGLRPEAEDELIFVREMCREYGVQFHGGAVSPGVLAKEAGMSIEMAARGRRKRFLNGVAKAHAAGKIALGHTQSDNAETMLMNIHRGTGLRGITGIHPVRNNIIRPLIFMRGSAVRKALVDKGIEFLEDRSNTDPEFLRNRVRHKILPALTEVFGENSSEKWGQLAENAAGSLSALKTLLGQLLLPMTQRDECGFRVERSFLQSFSASVLREAILFLLEDIAGSTYFVTAKRVEQLAAFISGTGYGEVNVHPEIGVRVLRSGGWLYFLKGASDVNVEIQEPGKYRSWFQEQFVFSREISEKPLINNDNVLFLDERLFPFPFQLAPVDLTKDRIMWNGETIRDIRHFVRKRGMGKIERDWMPVLKHGARILWIPGFAKGVSESEIGTGQNRIAVYFTADMR